MDTVAKRQSAADISQPWRGTAYPSGSVTQGERQAAAYMYSGVAASSAVADVDVFSVGGDQVIERFQPEKVVSAATTIWPWGLLKKTGGTDGP